MNGSSIVLLFKMSRIQQEILRVTNITNNSFAEMTQRELDGLYPTCAMAHNGVDVSGTSLSVSLENNTKDKA